VEPWSLLRQRRFRARGGADAGYTFQGNAAGGAAHARPVVFDLLALLWWRFRDKTLWHGGTKEARLELENAERAQLSSSRG
jgi:hypothetical protein